MTQAPIASATATGIARIAWAALFGLTALMLLNHAVGLFTFAKGDDERLMFALFALLNLLCLVILWGPFRKGEAWAWFASWIGVAGFAVTVVILGPDMGVGTFYLAVAVLLAVALLATRPAPSRAERDARA